MKLWNERAWAEIDTDALLNNLYEIRKKVTPGCRLLYVIKADAYGCGAEKVSELVEDAVDMFGVATADEAMELRRAGRRKPILILGCTPIPRVREMAENGITISVFSEEYAKAVRENLPEDRKLSAHLMVDSGMSRLGFYSHDGESCRKSVSEIVRTVRETGDRISYEGIFTHFCVADSFADEDKDFTEKQYRNFRCVTDGLEQEGIKGLIRHCCNSAATVNHPEMHLDMVRPGLILYGCLTDGLTDPPSIRPVMSVKATISQLRTLNPGDSVGYGRTFRATEATRIATVPMGYADGLSRVLSNRFRILVNGIPVFSAGNVCMDQFGCDVSGVPSVQEGQTVTLVGRENGEEITAEETAAAMGTISYEILTNIGKRLPRVYIGRKS